MRRLLLLLALITLPMAVLGQAKPYSKTVLQNGLTVIVKPEPDCGIVSIEVFIKAGASEERESNAGIGNLVARTLLASTRNKRAETVATVVDEVGGNFLTTWSPDYTEIRATTTKAGFNDAISLLGDILNNASFEQKWVEQSRQEMLTELTTKGDDVFNSTYQQVLRRLYQDNPYGRPMTGYSRTIRNLKAEDLQLFYQQYYVPNNMVISIAGDVTADDAVSRLKVAFAGTSEKPLPKQRKIPSETVAESKSEFVEKPVSAAYFMFGYLAPEVSSPDYPAALVASTALGRGKGSRMFQELREKKGLAYELGTIYPMRKNQSQMIAYLITDPYRHTFTQGSGIQTMVSQVKDAMLTEITKLQNEPLTAVELERAKQYAIGSYALEHQRLRERAFHLGMTEAIGGSCDFDYDYASKIEAVTADDVQKVAKKYFTNYALTIVLPNGSKVTETN